MAHKFSSIFIANLAEISLNLVHFMKPDEVEAEVSEDHALSDRFIFSQSNDTVLVTPYLINKNFFDDSIKLLGLKNVINLSPKVVGESVCKSIQEDAGLFKNITEIIKANPDIKIFSYSGTPEFFELIDVLKNRGLKFDTPEIPVSQNRWTNSFFGSKSGFRQTTSTLDESFPAPPIGAISPDRNEIVGWGSHFLKNYAGCVIKSNHGLAGAGLIIVRKEDVKGDVEKHITEIIRQHEYFQHGPIVVEQFIPPDMEICGGAPNIELRIKNNQVHPLYVCSMRMTSDGVFQGVEFGKNAVYKNVQKTLFRAGQKFGECLVVHGYNGFFELDFVAGIDHKIYPIESNLRRTGGTHAYELALKLMGKNALQENYFVTNNRILRDSLFKESYQSLKNKFSEILYPINGKKEGLILTIVSNLTRGRLGYVVIGKNKKEAIALEEKFLKII
jgi:hypothetical protein